MPVPDTSPAMGGPLVELRASDGSGCSRSTDSDHQLQELVLCYYGFRPFLDNAQVELSDSSPRTRSSSMTEETRARSVPTRRRAGRGQSGSGGGHSGSGGGHSAPGASRSASGSARSASGNGRSASSYTSSSNRAASGNGRSASASGQSASGGTRGSRNRTPVGSERSAAGASCTPTSSQAVTTAQRQMPVRQTTSDGGGRPSPAQRAEHAGVRTPGIESKANITQPPPAPGLLPTPPSTAQQRLSASSRCQVSRSHPSRPIPASASAPLLHTPPPTAPPLPPPPPPPPRHLAALMSRLGLMDLPPGALPPFVRVPPPPAGTVFFGSRSHGSLEVELDRCHLPRRRSRSGGEGPIRLTEPPPPPPPPPACCPGGWDHRDSYDPRLDDQRPQLWEERTREQARAEKLLKNFDMFRDWDYVPRLPADGGRHWRSCSDGDSDGSDGGCVENDGDCVENDGDVSGYSSADSDTEPTVTICSRVNGVFHYIPAQRLLKGTSAAPQRYDVTDTAVG